MSQKRISQLLAFIDQDPSDPFPRYALALEMDATGDTPGAIHTLEDLLIRAPRYVATYQHLGGLYQKIGSIEKARTVLSAGIMVAQKENDLHAAQEMSEALEDLEN